MHSVSTVGRPVAERRQRHLRVAVYAALLRVGAFLAAGLTEILLGWHLVALGFAAVAVFAPWPARQLADERVDHERFTVESPGPPKGLPTRPPEANNE